MTTDQPDSERAVQCRACAVIFRVSELVDGKLPKHSPVGIFNARCSRSGTNNYRHEGEK